MPRTKPSNAAKQTYVERVISATSYLQRHLKKRAVHPNSIRNQVSKAAEARGQSLGPRANTYIRHAIHNLKDRGLLESASSGGAVSLSPQARKAMTNVRRHRTESPTSHAHSPIHSSDEDTRSRALYRKARSSSPAKRTNRNRASATPSPDHRSISQNATPEVGPSDRRPQEETFEANTARLLEGMEPVKPVSKMNKAELFSRVRFDSETLYKVHNELACQEATVRELTYSNTEKAERLAERERQLEALKEEVSKKESEIRALRATSVFAADDDDPELVSAVRKSLSATGSARKNVSHHPTPSPSDSSRISSPEIEVGAGHLEQTIPAVPSTLSEPYYVVQAPSSPRLELAEATITSLRATCSALEQQVLQLGLDKLALQTENQNLKAKVEQLTVDHLELDATIALAGTLQAALAASEAKFPSISGLSTGYADATQTAREKGVLQESITSLDSDRAALQTRVQELEGDLPSTSVDFLKRTRGEIEREEEGSPGSKRRRMEEHDRPRLSAVRRKTPPRTRAAGPAPK